MYTVGVSNIQYTIRNVPEDLDKKLRLRSKKKGESFNTTLLKALNLSTSSNTSSDLDWFYGSGGIGEEELQAFSDQRIIDTSAWNIK
jgi:hypothetical protein